MAPWSVIGLCQFGKRRPGQVRTEQYGVKTARHPVGTVDGQAQGLELGPGQAASRLGGRSRAAGPGPAPAGAVRGGPDGGPGCRGGPAPRREPGGAAIAADRG